MTVMHMQVTIVAMMARLERPSLLWLVPGLDVGVLDGELLGEGVSAGKGSPGLSMYVLRNASCCCCCTLVEALGLMAPTIPKFRQLPGAEQ